MGLVYADQDKVDAAISHCQQALTIAQDIGDRQGEGNALLNLGNAYAALGQVDKAIGLLEQAVRIGQEIKDPRIVQGCGRSLKKLRGW